MSGIGRFGRTPPVRAAAAGCRWVWDSLIAPPPGRWNEPPEWLHDFVDAAACAYMAWLRMIAEAEVKAGRWPAPRRLGASTDQPGVRASPREPSGSSVQSLRVRRARACFAHIARNWDPVWVAPRGGHKQGRSRLPRQSNRLGPSMRQLAAQWGMESLGAGGAGIEVLDDLIRCGAITRQPDGSYELAGSADAIARIASLT